MRATRSRRVHRSDRVLGTGSGKMQVLTTNNRHGVRVRESPSNEFQRPFAWKALGELQSVDGFVGDPRSEDELPDVGFGERRPQLGYLCPGVETDREIVELID